MFLCLLRRRTGTLEPCNTITAYSFFGVRMKFKAGKVIPERPPSSDTLLSAVIKEVCGTDAGLCEGDARNGFPDDMLRVKSNALFYVHGRGLGCCRTARDAQLLVLMSGCREHQRRHPCWDDPEAQP